MTLSGSVNGLFGPDILTEMRRWWEISRSQTACRLGKKINVRLPDYVTMMTAWNDHDETALFIYDQ